MVDRAAEPPGSDLPVARTVTDVIADVEGASIPRWMQPLALVGALGLAIGGASIAAFVWRRGVYRKAPAPDQALRSGWVKSRASRLLPVKVAAVLLGLVLVSFTWRALSVPSEWSGDPVVSAEQRNVFSAEVSEVEPGWLVVVNGSEGFSPTPGGRCVASEKSVTHSAGDLVGVVQAADGRGCMTVEAYLRARALLGPSPLALWGLGLGLVLLVWRVLPGVRFYRAWNQGWLDEAQYEAPDRKHIASSETL